MVRETDPDPDTSKVRLRVPTPEDGATLWRLAQACPPLEVNTCYAYVLLCTHFAETCVLAECDGEPVGYVTGYIPPTQSDTVFVWQIGVAPAGRGKGLGVTMLRALFSREICRDVRYMDTTITPSNTVSRRLFARVAEKMGAPHEACPFMSKELFAGESHEPEDLIRIGPLPDGGA